MYTMMKNASVFLFAFLLGICSAIAQTPDYQLSSHVLDISKATPASGVVVSLYKYDTQSQRWDFVDKVPTDQNGRVTGFLPVNEDNFGAYKLRFETEPYFQSQGLASIYPYIEVCFYVRDSTHYHIPVTVSANGYSTYRGN